MFYKKLFIFSIFSFIFLQISFAGAACPATTQNGVVELCNPLTNDSANIDIPTLVGKIIHSVLGIVGSLALVVFIYGGLLWMTSAGKQEQVTKGRDAMLWAAIGIIIIFSAYALVNLVLTTITAK